MYSDLEWWETFLDVWNGVSILCPLRISVPDHEVYTDASGTFGCGAVWANHLLQFKWPEFYSSVAIFPKELVPIVTTCFVWGQKWLFIFIQTMRQWWQWLTQGIARTQR